MMLRLILVGLVTSMGLELPSGRDVSCWAESGRAWATAQVAALTPGGEVAPTGVAEVAVGPVEADRAFEAIGAEMAADLAADRALACAQVPALAQPDAGCDGDTAAAVAEAVAVAEAQAEPGVIEEVVIGLPSGEEVAAVALSTPADEPVVTVAVAVAVAEEDMECGDDTPSQSDRLAEAVRLTRQAAQAWADLIQEPADEAPCGR